jgi:hypothetical protein
MNIGDELVDEGFEIFVSLSLAAQLGVLNDRAAAERLFPRRSAQGLAVACPPIGGQGVHPLCRPIGGGLAR